jgi:hypothetical protein
MGLVFASEYDQNSLLYTVTKREIGGITVQRSSRNVTSYEAFVETTKQACEPVSALYNVYVTYPRGVQTIQHSLIDVGVLPKKMFQYDEGLTLVLPPDPQSLQNWYQRITATLPIANQWALSDALGLVLVDNFYLTILGPVLEEEGCTKRNNPNNATDIYDCNFLGYALGNSSSELRVLLLLLPQLTNT